MSAAPWFRSAPVRGGSFLLNRCEYAQVRYGVGSDATATIENGTGVMANHSNNDNDGRARSPAPVHPRVIRFDDDTELTAPHNACMDDADATREIEAISQHAAHSPPRFPAELVVDRDGTLASTAAEITDLSRSAVFVATAACPDTGRSAHIRLHSRFGVGTAIGAVESHLSGAGFVVRLTACSELFTEFADELRAYAEGRGHGGPPLIGAIELHVL